MIKKYSNFINERLGVPEGNVEMAENIYKFILKILNKKSSSIVSEDNIIEINRVKSIQLGTFRSIKVGDLEFKDIQISIKPYFNDKEFEITGMSVWVRHSDMNNTSFLYDKNKISNIELTINYAIIEGKTTYKDIYNNFIENKADMTGTLSHEIKHIYDKYMFGKEMFGDVSSYQTFSNKRFGIYFI